MLESNLVTPRETIGGRLRRYAANTLAGISLILVISVAYIWDRSYSIWDNFDTKWEMAPRRWMVYSSYGGFGICVEDASNVTAPPHLIRRDGPVDPVVAREYMAREYTQGRHGINPRYPYTGSVGAFGTDHVWGHGFRFTSYARPAPPPYGGSTHGIYVVFPYWFLALLTGSPFLLRLTQLTARAVRKRHRRTRGLCHRCGFDLRASPDRCPECGLATERQRELPKPEASVNS